MAAPIPRGYQNLAVEQGVAARRRGCRVFCICLPTGAGKSTVGCMFIQRCLALDKRSLFVVHRRGLVEQFSDNLIDWQIDHAVCMRGHPKEGGSKVQVASRDTLLVQGYELPPADLVIVDEGRHAASPEFRRLLKVYEDQGATIILLDATPCLPDGTGLGPWCQALIQPVKTTELVAAGALLPVDCYAPDRKMKKNRPLRGIAGDLVDSWETYARGLPTVLFNSRIQHSIDAVAEFNAAGIPAVHIDASTPDYVRDLIFGCDGKPGQLETGEIKVVSNVGLITEGTDVPCLGCAQINCEMESRSGYLQRTGRIMRPFPGQERAVIIDHSGAVWRFGFPDEDQEWRLHGNLDADWQERNSRGDTATKLYCSHCNLVYHSSAHCPTCGRLPVKPPRSVFDPPPVSRRQEMLVEADRHDGSLREKMERDQRVKHWYRCLAGAYHQRGSFGMAAQVYRRRYGEWPGNDFPHMPARNEWQMRVCDKHPDFTARKRQKSVD